MGGNPDLAASPRSVATDYARFLKRLDVVTVVAHLERQRLLGWILAWSGLSCGWSTDDRDAASIANKIARFANAEIDQSRGGATAS